MLLQSTNFPEEYPWRTEGLFSAHYLTQRLPLSGVTLWPEQASSDAVFSKAYKILTANLNGLRKGNEEDCEDRLISKILDLLGFGYSNRRAIPKAEQRLLPDYLLYASAEIADAKFQQGTREAYYADCIGILEAKRWGYHLSEDASGKDTPKRERSPHYQIRDYLSESGDLVWGILTNGAKWRLYCKKDRASSFFEFDLESVLTHDGTENDETRARAQFQYFYALFRRDAFVRGQGGACLLDTIRNEAAHFQEDVERRLRVQVFDCVEILGKGFLDNPRNNLSESDLSAIYENTLILLYRILFVLNAEARELLPTRPTNERSRAYYHAFGLELIRGKLASVDSADEYADDVTFQLHERLRGLFHLINGDSAYFRRDKNAELDIPRYNGGLFAPERYPFLEEKRVADHYLSLVLKKLCFRETGTSDLIAFDYAGLGERHLGSIYEGLLEHHFFVEDSAPKLANNRGERKALGAYYTPAAWVSYIVEASLRPLLERAHANSLPGHEASTAEPDDSFANAVLKLKVCDPAMGSGHFLVEATTFLAEAIAAHPTTAPRARLNADGTLQLKSDGGGEPLFTEEAKLAYWKRRTVESCIYGVDYNPLAVELAKLSLWLKTVDRVPLNFLDHHLRCGNSLIGTNLQALPHFPKVKNGGKNGNKANGAQLSLLFTEDLREAVKRAIADIGAIEAVDTDTHQSAKEKERLWREISETLMPRFRAIGDLWIGPWFGSDIGGDQYTASIDDASKTQAARAALNGVFDTLRPFHWEMEFPDIFFDEQGDPKSSPGFDAVVGNPPWERIKLQENEFFAGRDRAIAHAAKAADRKKLVAGLQAANPQLWAEYETASARAEQTLAFLHRSGFYPLMGRGDTNLYAVFAEKALQLVSATGLVGLLVPSGIATDDTTKHYFQYLVKSRRLAELLDFENREKPFEDVDSRFKFSILRITGEGEPQNHVRCGFFLHSVDGLKEPGRVFNLDAEDFKLFNPNSLTCPIFRRRRDMELTRKIYGNVPVLVNESMEETGNPWGVRFSTMFHMTNDSKLFKTAKELEKDGYWLGVGNVYTKGQVRYLPLYEGKMAQTYDHRAASIVVNPENVHRPAQEIPTKPGQYIDPAYSPQPHYWIDTRKAAAHFGGTPPHWLIGYKDVTSPTNMRTVIPAAIPFAGVGNTFCLINVSALLSADRRACFVANLSSFVLDYAARQKVGGQHLNFFIVEQFPILPPDRYAQLWHGEGLADFIGLRVLELCYTAHDMKGFAEEMGYDGPPYAWNEERRLHLRCQLDALYFLLYGLDREEAAEILETFPIVKRQDESKYAGRFRTKDLIVGYINAYSAGNMDAWVKG